MSAVPGSRPDRPRGRAAFGVATSPGPAVVAIAVFTRDLRIHDHPVLAAAAEDSAGHVVPIFVLDDRILTRVACGSARMRFLVEALTDLDGSLRDRGSRLILRRGDFVEEVCRLAEQVDAFDVHIASDVSAFAQARQTALAAALATQSRRLHIHEQVHTIQEPGAVVPAGRDHFAVFTPYYRRWAEARLRAPADAPARLWMPETEPASEPLPDVDRTVPSRFPGGETAGRRLAGKWLAGPVDAYAAGHDDLAGDATSRLSPYLHFGCLSPTELLARAGHGPAASAGREAFARQLAWRDFHHQVLAARPSASRADYRPRGDRWQDDPDALSAWAEGRTGIPIVDAGMRQLLAEGWMHNRARLITASFLTKTLYVDWRLGADHFAAHLLDADVADNAMNWQWVAGTGTDSRPNRVLNPLRQAERYDPAGEFVRRYVPELADLQNPRDVHQPWRLGEAELRRRGYPPPMADLGAARSRFLLHREQGNVP